MVGPSSILSTTFLLHLFCRHLRKDLQNFATAKKFLSSDLLLYIEKWMLPSRAKLLFLNLAQQKRCLVVTSRYLLPPQAYLSLGEIAGSLNCLWSPPGASLLAIIFFYVLVTFRLYSNRSKLHTLDSGRRNFVYMDS